MEPSDMTAADLRESFVRKKLSPVEVLRAVRARTEKAEPHLCALWACDFEKAMKSAVLSEQRYLRGESLSMLDGIPVTVKENLRTAGLASPLGTAAADMTPAQADSPPVARMRAAGMVDFARTTMPDYGMLSSGLSSFHKLARNPWNLAKTPGGSSSGAGAAAAAGYGPLHIGTDIGGSIRLPGGWCGIFAFKPSLGRAPIDPPFTGRVAGPMTRNVRDAALFMRVLAQPDARDHMSLPASDIDWEDLSFALRGKKIALHLDAGCGQPVHPETLAAVSAAAKLFESAGAIIEPLAPFLTREMLDGQDRFWRARGWADIKNLPEERKAKILPFIRQWIETARAYTGEDVYDGFAQSLAIRETTARITQAYDFVLSPTAPQPAFDAHLPCPTNDPALPFEHICFTLPYNMSEQPAASINCGYTSDGLPIGLQIAGRRFDDLGVLQASAFYERARPAQRPWPTF